MPTTKKKTSESNKSSKRRLVFDDEEKEDEQAQQPPPTTTTDSASSSSPLKKRKGAMDAFTTPPPAKKKQQHQQRRATTAKVLVVTPEEKERQALSDYVPKYIHKTVDYCRQGQATLSETTLKVFDWIAQHYVIPVDLEQNRAYGPLSGTCYERRVVQAYSLGKLQAKQGDLDTVDVICTCCATVGHQRDDCPTLI